MNTAIRLRTAAAGPLAGFLILILAMTGAAPGSADPAERTRIEAFLSVTGFDVALDSIALSASDAPEMLGLDVGDFGPAWTTVARRVFDTGLMREMALDVLEKALPDDLLDHAVEFYASDLGQRLVKVENAAHMMEDDTIRLKEGARILAELAASGSPRIDLLRRMNRAIDGSGRSVKALQEIQYRFLLAASAAGVIELRLDPDELRAMMEREADDLRKVLEQSSLAGAAWTYRALSDEDLRAYAEALENPKMQQVYELLNTVQYEIMANRFEVLAGKMAGLKPGQDI